LYFGAVLTPFAGGALLRIKILFVRIGKYRTWSIRRGCLASTGLRGLFGVRNTELGVNLDVVKTSNGLWSANLEVR
jgi:hypothetical protein